MFQRTGGYGGGGDRGRGDGRGGQRGGRGQGEGRGGFEAGRGRGGGRSMSEERGGRGYPQEGGRGRGGQPGAGRPGPGGRGGGRSQSAGPARGRMSANEAVVATKAVFQKPGLVLRKPSETLPNGHAKRPNLGTLGQPTVVLANHFRIARVEDDKKVWQYAVFIEKQPRAPREGAAGPSAAVAQPAPQEGPPPMPDRNRCYDLLNRLAQQMDWPFNQWAYDGRQILFTAEEFLPAQQAWYTLQVRDVPLQQQQQQQPGAATGRQGPPVQREVTYKISTKLTAVLDISGDLKRFRSGEEADFQRESLQALDVALRQSAASNPANRVMGRGVYTSEGKKKIGFGTEAWHGYVQSLNVVQCGLTLTMDKAVAAMHMMEDLLAFVVEVLQIPANALGLRPLTASQIGQLNDVVKRKTITVQVKHRTNGKCRHRIRSFTLTSAVNSMFTLKDGTTTNVAQFFEQNYRRLQFPNLPCVVAGSSSGSSRRAEGGSKPMWLPIEVCMIVPETGRRALGPDETRQILAIAAVDPMERQHKVMDTLVRKAKLHQDLTAQAFGVHLEAQPEMMRVPARILPTPKLEYGNGVHLDPGDRGDWNIMNVRLFRPATLRSFAIVSYVPDSKLFTPDRNLMAEFLQELRRALEEKGLAWQLLGRPPVLFKTRSQSNEDVLRQAVAEAQQQCGAQLQIVFVLQEWENQVYNDVKLICDSILGIQSQCLVADQMGMTPRSQPGSMGRKMAGVALKVNMKLGGENWSVSSHPGIWVPVLNRGSDERAIPKVMLLGADVTHPTNLPEQAGNSSEVGPGRTPPEMSSVAAVVGSINPSCTRFAARVFAQSPLQEYVDGMGNAVASLLQTWHRVNKCYPDTLIMFRDGVSEGQFNAVLARELESIKQACAAIPNYRPRITFACVQKRHQTRLYALDGDGAGLRSSHDAKGRGNVTPGTVVDREICHAVEFDFYLNSHAGIQGTNKPAKYHVLYDDNGFSADSMQLFAYWLCHTWARCTRTVSYCPPAYYAHHAAFRGRCRLRRDEYDDRSVASGGTSASAATAATTWTFHPLHANLLDTMYFI